MYVRVHVIKKKIYIRRHAERRCVIPNNATSNNELELADELGYSRRKGRKKKGKKNSTNSPDPSLPKRPTPLSRISSKHEKIYAGNDVRASRVCSQDYAVHLIRRILISRYNIY